ncbi:hypothetical protein GSQ51_15915 [Clostridioides difficile]|nr:hypothetical protein [Clostridioides difficile]NJK15579.1 hypothetical protein [Clostridioides difficile]
MIHTAQLYTNISFNEKKDIEKRFKMDIEEVMKEMNNNNKGISFSGKNRESHYQITVFTDITKILNRGDVYEEDYDEVMKSIDRAIEDLVGYALELTLIRIEYRIDKYIKSKKERLVLIHMYKKMIDKYGFKVKKKKFKTSVGYMSKSMQLVIYDKESEREAKSEECKSYEECMLRFEVKLLRSHLNYNKRKYGIEKDLKNYFNESLQVKYMLSNIRKVMYRGDYYTIGEATKIIDKSNIKEEDKKKLREFLVDISIKGVTGAKELEGYKKGKVKYTDYKFKKIVGMLGALNINPIVIPKCKEYLYDEKCSYIKNPFDL